MNSIVYFQFAISGFTHLYLAITRFRMAVHFADIYLFIYKYCCTLPCRNMDKQISTMLV